MRSTAPPMRFCCLLPREEGCALRRERLSLARDRADHVDAVFRRSELHLRKPYAEAKRALKQFPTIGDPGAEKILLFCGLASGLPLESNGLRVLVRLGWGRLQKDYAATYRSVRDDLAPDLPSDPDRLKQAYLLLREHGKTLCKDKSPLCHECPLARDCDYATKRAAPVATPKPQGRTTRSAPATGTTPLVRR